MSDDEFRALVEQGPAVVMVSKEDMLRLLDRPRAAAEAMREAAAEYVRVGADGYADLESHCHDALVDAIRALPLPGDNNQGTRS